MSTRSFNCLHTAGMTSLADILICSESELLHLPGLGNSSLLEIRDMVALHGYKLGQLLEEGYANSQTPTSAVPKIPSHNQKPGVKAEGAIPYYGDQNMLKRIEDLPISLRAKNAIRVEGITFVAQLLQRTSIEIMKVPNIGKLSYKEVVHTLEELGGYRLGTVRIGQSIYKEADIRTIFGLDEAKAVPSPEFSVAIDYPQSMSGFLTHEFMNQVIEESVRSIAQDVLAQALDREINTKVMMVKEGGIISLEQTPKPSAVNDKKIVFKFTVPEKYRGILCDEFIAATISNLGQDLTRACESAFLTSIQTKALRNG